MDSLRAACRYGYTLGGKMKDEYAAVRASQLRVALDRLRKAEKLLLEAEGALWSVERTESQKLVTAQDVVTDAISALGKLTDPDYVESVGTECGCSNPYCQA